MDYHGEQRTLFVLMFLIMTVQSCVQEIKFNKEFKTKMKTFKVLITF